MDTRLDDSRDEVIVVGSRFLQVADLLLDPAELLIAIGRGRFRISQAPGLLNELLDLLACLISNLRPLFRNTRPVGAPHTCEHSCQGVIVATVDRIELMIVTTGTGDRQTQKGSPHCIDTLLPLFRHNHADNLWSKQQFLVIHRTDSEKAQGRYILQPRFVHEISSQLPLRKLVVGHILVQGPHDPVAIAVRTAVRNNPTLPDIGVTGQVKPRSSPTLSVVRGG